MKKINIRYFDNMLKLLELECDKFNYEIDNNVYYLELCSVLTLYENEVNTLKCNYYINKLNNALQYLLKDLHYIKKVV